MQHNTTTAMSAASDDFLYRSEVLQLDSGQTESAVDDQLLREARALGIAKSHSHTSTPIATSESAVTLPTLPIRSGSITSQATESTGLTSRSSHELRHPSQPVAPASPSRRRTFNAKSLVVTEYEKFLANAQAQDRSTSARGRKPPPVPSIPRSNSTPSIISATSRRSSYSVKRGLSRFTKLSKSKKIHAGLTSCISCRHGVQPSSSTLHTLSCSHTHCEACLHKLIMRAMQPKLPMPPKCCKNPIPGWIVKAVLNPKEQQSFLQRISQSATLWDDKITCPNTRCRAVMSNDPQVDARRPYEMICAKCRTKVCRTCKKMAHSLGPICPNDWELDAVLQMKEGQGWRRCYNGRCRAIVPLSRGRAHMKCRCKAEFCYLCGAIWNPTSGCLNACDTKELKVEYEKGRELKDKIDIIAAQMLEADVESATEKLEAAQRTQDNEELKHLLIRHLEERDRFMGFEKQQKWFLWTRQGQEKVEMLDRHAEARTKMEEQHQTTATTLEDRQVTAEMEFRKTLDQERKACEVRLRHMEAYCHGLNAKGTVLGRVVTERDLRELDQQYNVRDNMERLQESRINVLREKQAKALKTLMTKQVEVCGSFEKDLVKEGEELDQRFSQEEEDFTQLFRERKDRLEKRWRRRAEIVRKKLAVEMGLTYGPLPPVDWSIVEKEAEKMSIPVTDLIADVALKTRAAFSEEPIITTEEELGLGEPVTGEDAMDHGSIKAAA